MYRLVTILENFFITLLSKVLQLADFLGATGITLLAGAAMGWETYHLDMHGPKLCNR